MTPKNKSAQCNREEKTTALLPPPPDASPRLLEIFGDIVEPLTPAIIYNLYAMQQDGKKEYFQCCEKCVNAKEEEKPSCDCVSMPSKVVYEPITLLICSPGGCVDEMFAIYDVMRDIQKSGFDVHTVGVGRVMSAAVLLLAAGTPGMRKVGQNCRLMLHNIFGSPEGDLKRLLSETGELDRQQQKYFNLLRKLTKLPKKIYKQISETQCNLYFTAEEAVEYGIADEIL